jgi:hypothetical protein
VALRIESDPEVAAIFDRYPAVVRDKVLNLRRLIIEVAEEAEPLHELEEAVKWGEPSYLTKHGSTIRVGWKAKQPDQYAMYFKCTSKLVETFKVVYGDVFCFEGTRAIVFQLPDEVPQLELKDCIRAGLTYHKVKNLPQLGLSERR